MSDQGVSTDPKQVEAVRSCPILQSLEDVTSFLGLCSYYRCLLRIFSEIAKLLQRLTEKGKRFPRTPEYQLVMDLIPWLPSFHCTAWKSTLLPKGDVYSRFLVACLSAAAAACFSRCCESALLRTLIGSRTVWSRALDLRSAYCFQCELMYENYGLPGRSVPPQIDSDKSRNELYR